MIGAFDNNDDVNITIVTGDARDVIADEGGAADIDTGSYADTDYAASAEAGAFPDTSSCC